VTADRDRRRAGRAECAEEIVGEPGLADAHFPLDDGQTAVALHTPVAVEQRCQLSAATDERRLRLRHRRLEVSGQGRIGDGRRGGRAALLDRAVQARRLLDRGHTELRVEDADAIAVLPHGRRALAVSGIELDQRAVCRLVQRVEAEATACVGDRGVVVTP
jgi:hypothetical protein